MKCFKDAMIDVVKLLEECSELQQYFPNKHQYSGFTDLYNTVVHLVSHRRNYDKSEYYRELSEILNEHRHFVDKVIHMRFGAAKAILDEPYEYGTRGIPIPHEFNMRHFNKWRDMKESFANVMSFLSDNLGRHEHE